MMWEGKLREASFRGVPFFVEAGGLTAGRRLQVHEYPQRDNPYPEDMGRAARDITITAFLVGENALSDGERLLQALEASGAGTLVHPWMGQMQVVAQPSRMSQGRDSNGVVQIEFSFVEAGALAFPSGGISTSSISKLQGGLLQDASTKDFLKTFGVDGYPSFVSDDALTSLESSLDAAGGNFSYLPGFSGNLNSILADLGGLVGIPSTLVTRVFSLFSGNEPKVVTPPASNRTLSTVVSSTAANTASTSAQTQASYRYINTLVAATSNPVLAAQPTPDPTLAPSRQQVKNNANAVSAIARQALLVEAVKVSSTLPAHVFDDVIAVRNNLTSALDAETLTASDDLYPVLTNTRVAVHKDLTRRAQDAARLRNIQLPDTTPSLALAYDLYEDAGRAQEIVDRNKVIHPGFTPPVELRVLAR